MDTVVSEGEVNIVSKEWFIGGKILANCFIGQVLPVCEKLVPNLKGPLSLFAPSRCFCIPNSKSSFE